MVKETPKVGGEEVTVMEVIIRGEPKEIAALVLAVQGRQMEMEEIADGVGTIFATQVH